MQASTIGMAWYEQEDYPRILAIMEDAEKLPYSYDEFLQIAERAERELTAKGIVIIRAIIKPDEFLVWCKAHNLKVDAEARMAFGTEVATQHINKTTTRH